MRKEDKDCSFVGTRRYFGVALFFDTIGTTIMSKLSGAGFSFNLHGITGAIALLLMIFHACWATIILVKKDRSAQQTFHKFSILVWAIWLIPFVLGIFIGIRG